MRNYNQHIINTHLKSIFLLFVFSIPLVLVTPLAFAEGGGGIECPESSGVYSYVDGSASYQENPFDQGNLATLSCEYLTLSEDEDIEPLGQVNAIFHVSGQLNQELIDEYGCGAILGEQFSPTYVSSTTHFGSVAFTSAPLLEAAADIMSQIETNNLATLCDIETDAEGSEGSTAESVKEAIEEHETIDESSMEISIEEINQESLETIEEKVKEHLEEVKAQEAPDSQILKIVLPDWIKNNAQWWSTDQITDDDFSLGIEFMIKEGFIRIPSTEVSAEKSSEIPDWVKNNAGWWADGSISDEDFVNGLQFLISKGIISVS